MGQSLGWHEVESPMPLRILLSVVCPCSQVDSAYSWICTASWTLGLSSGIHWATKAHFERVCSVTEALVVTTLGQRHTQNAHFGNLLHSCEVPQTLGHGLW